MNVPKQRRRQMERKVEHWPQAVTGPGVWDGRQVDPKVFRVALAPAVIADLLKQGAAMRQEGASIRAGQVSCDRFPLKAFEEEAVRIRRELSTGTGIVILTGFPVDQPDDDVERMYFLLCEYIGVCVTQNCSAGLVHHVTLGPKAPKMGTRTVGAAGHVGLHVDLADVVGLLCVRQNPDNPPSHAASTLALYNEINARYPDIMPMLRQGSPWSRMGEHGNDETKTPYNVPIFSVSEDGLVSCRYNRGWQERPSEGVEVDSDMHSAFDVIDSVASDIKIKFDFQPGDIQLVSNLTAFHGRDAHAPAEVPGTERWLMRTWMYLPDFRPIADEPLNRYGILRHGNMGLTATELAHALETAPPGFVPGPDSTLDFPQPRRSDGTPLRSVPGRQPVAPSL